MNSYQVNPVVAPTVAFAGAHLAIFFVSSHYLLSFVFFILCAFQILPISTTAALQRQGVDQGLK